MLVALVALSTNQRECPRRKAPSGSATKLDGDTILVGSGSNPDTLIFRPVPPADGLDNRIHLAAMREAVAQQQDLHILLDKDLFVCYIML